MGGGREEGWCCRRKGREERRDPGRYAVLVVWCRFEGVCVCVCEAVCVRLYV